MATIIKEELRTLQNREASIKISTVRSLVLSTLVYSVKKMAFCKDVGAKVAEI